MTSQPEQILENSLVAQLVQLGYERVSIKDEEAMLANLKRQLEKNNKVELSDGEFRQIVNALSKGSIFDRAKVLRDRVAYRNAEGKTRTVELINQRHWCQNEFQVTQQVTMEGRYKNRYDVTLLINGLPLVQIELKRRGLELKEAFNQINRYERHSFGAGVGLFQFVQIFMISNGVNTKYYANNPVRARSFKQTFYWSDEKNKLITQLEPFADAFLTPCHLAKMITKYVVLNESQKALMVLRPYQYYATEAIIERVKTTTDFGYIWHTTGSGKTLTSFKTAQLLTELAKVHKVLFVVDRKDLDYQTAREFNSFSKGSIDSTTDTKTLVKQLRGKNSLVVTTIQKLNTAIGKTRYRKQLTALQDERIVFIFDECHRSQFGKTHHEIKNFFHGGQMFGFTGTPIFAKNAGRNEFGKRTTAMLFDKCLHKYVITDAIKDANVLKFSVEYVSTFKKKAEIIDQKVEAIDEAEVFRAPGHIEKVVEYIIANHDRKTHQRKFTAILAVSGVPQLTDYYRELHARKEAGEHDLRVATIFTYRDNEEDVEATGTLLSDEEFLSNDPYTLSLAEDVAVPYGEPKVQHSRDDLEEFIGDYNSLYRTNFTSKDSQSFYNYYNDIARRVKHQQIDILLVVGMFLTGFDSKSLNTLYVDKNLKYHSLIQAYSRTNRILDELKSQGNIVVFRNLRKATNEALALFSTEDAKDTIILAPFEEYVTKFGLAYGELLSIAPTVDSVNDLIDETAELDFIKAFRALIRLRNVLKTFTQFDHDKLPMSAQLFEDYKSKYLDLYDKARRESQVNKHSILGDIDFELELIHRDEVNVSYILRLLAKLKDAPAVEEEQQRKAIVDLVAGDTELRSKRELIEKFIDKYLPTVEDSEDVEEAFTEFWKLEQVAAFQDLATEEQLDKDKLEQVVENYLFTNRPPLRDEVIGTMLVRPKLKDRKQRAEWVTERMLGFVETFISGGI